MRRMQKILTGVFLGGVLLSGIGTGVAFVEYSSFAYAGEKQIGQQTLVTRELDFRFEPENGKIHVVRGFWNGRIMEDRIEADENVPAGTVRYVVTYNEKRAEPFLEYEEIEKEDLIELEDGQETEKQGVPEDGRGDAKDAEKTELPKQGYLLLRVYNVGNDLEVFLECKDEVLKEFKEKKISHYDVAYVTDVKIKVHPDTMPYIVSDFR